MKILNMGIVAHVDAGKTSLTERLLFDAGVIDHVGSVDSGDTQTDSMDLERQRGITIKSAVVSFTVDDLKINLIDTPGHPEFISEVERALRVLDGAILVISAVEGVQAQTRILMRTLSRLKVPTLLFVNKVDRMGAAYDELLDGIRRKLTPAALPMNRVEDIGTRTAGIVAYDLDKDPQHFVRMAETLAENDDRFLAAYLSDDGELGTADCEHALTSQTGKAQVHPVYFGSARTGVGVPELTTGIRCLLPTTDEGEPDGEQPLRGTVFKIDRGKSGEKVAYVRVSSGSIESRQQVRFYRPTRATEYAELSGKVTEIRAFDRGASSTQTGRVTAGNIAKLWGLKEIQIGDQLGAAYQPASAAYFSPPTLETLVRPRDPANAAALYMALQTLTEQDPLIDTRRDEEQQELTVRLYGEVQKEVLESQLATEFGLDVVFDETKTIYVERPVGVGEAFAEIGKDNEYPVTLGFRVEPTPPGSGVAYVMASERGSLLRGFHTTVEDSVYERLRTGLLGWEIVDCMVSLTRSAYSTGTVHEHFRLLTPQLLDQALRQAGTQVCEPLARFEVEVPPDSIGGVLTKLIELGAMPGDPTIEREAAYLEGVIASDKVHELERRLPGLSHGEGVLLTEFEGYRPIEGPPPRRRPKTR